MVRIAVIGAGSSGIVATKTCLEYGYDVVCYEKDGDLGGLWRYKPEEKAGEASVMKSTVIDTSKEMCAYSDFPPPKEYANFMHNRQMLQYFRSYAEHFNVLPRIKYNSEVESIKRAQDFDATGRWVVTTTDSKRGGNSTSETFDGVLLCTGHHAFPYEPEFPGLRDKFTGQVLHSQLYKEPSPFDEKTVLVVGIGNSAADVNVELSRVAKKVYLVTRRGTWIWNRVFDRGVPFDLIVNSHLWDPLQRYFPKLVQAHFERKLLQRVDLETYGLLPAHHLFQQHPTITDELPNRIASGAITVKPNVKQFTGPRSCTFEDGTSADDIDAVVLCTGYAFGFPCLEPGVIPVENNRVDLYKYMYPPNIPHPETLAVIGLIQPIGAIFPIAEMQCRVFCEHVAGKRALPDREKMYEDIKMKKKELSDLYVESNRHTIEAPYVSFITELAGMIDAKPSSPLTYLLKGDPKLAWALTVGPCLSYEFRLRGPNPWPGARDAIVTVQDRVVGATKTRQPPAHCGCGKGRSHGFDCVLKEYKVYIAALIAVCAALLFAVLFAF